MKRLVRFFIALILSIGVYPVVAQNEQNVQSNQSNQNDDQNALRQVVEKNEYGNNWLISLGGNANLLGGEQDGGISMWKRLQFGGGLTVGKWFTSDFGARLQVDGGALRGFNYADDRGGYFVFTNYHHQQNPAYPIGGPFYDPVTGEPNPKYKFVTAKDGTQGIWQDFNYASATIDLMANFTNLMRGHDSGHNPIDVIPFVGLGAIHAFSNNTTTPSFYWFLGKVGVRVNFNINNNWAIYLEPKINITDKEFDGYVGTSSADGVVNLGLGVQYTFNKKFTSMYEVAQLTADEIDRLNKKINDNRYLINNQQDILERQQDLLDRLQKCCDDNKKQVVTQVVESTACLPEYVRFSLDSYKIEPTEQRKIAEVADYLKKNPSSKILIVGYADKNTGNPKYNMNLSKKRVDVVTAQLQNLGINSNRVVSEWKGDKEQPFPQNEWNRVVIMVERK